MPTSELLLKDVIEIKQDVHAGDFNVLVDLSGALQRERTGLKLAQELLRRRDDLKLGELIPLGDL